MSASVSVFDWIWLQSSSKEAKMKTLLALLALVAVSWALPVAAQSPTQTPTQSTTQAQGQAAPQGQAANPGQAVPQAPVTQPVRGLISTGVGAVGGTAGGLIGLLIAAAYVRGSDSNDGFAALGLAFLGAFVGYALAIPVAVYLTGYLLDGDGNIFITALASWAGLALGALAFAGLAQSTNDDVGIVLGFGVMTLLSAGSGALAFELTSPASRTAANRGLTLAPIVAPSADSRGVVIGLGGTF
jgi:hypothetical protein